MKTKKKLLAVLCTLAMMLSLLSGTAFNASSMYTAVDFDDGQSEDFYQELATLIKSRNAMGRNAQTATDNPYSSARLIAFAENELDPSRFDTLACLYDGSGMWVLQFWTPTAAIEAQRQLAQMGIKSQPDVCITCDPQENEEFGQMNAQGSEHLSWGVADGHFDRFLSQYGFKFTGSGIVAVVDSGIDATHPFMRGKVLQGFDFIDGDTNAHDEFYHGTLVASVVVDCVGDAPVSILPIRIFDSNGRGYSSTIATGIKYAADHGADVINLSLGGGHDDAGDYAIQYAINKGAIVTIAAGNENESTENSCPAHLTIPGAVVVASGNSYHQKAQHSNYGKSVDLMAPGVNVKGAVPGNKYKTTGGTSLATPHVSAAAMLLDLAWGKNLSAAQLEKKLYTATTSGSRVNDYYGYGFLDMAKASVPNPAPTQPAPPSGLVIPGTYRIEAYCGKVVEVADSQSGDGANVQIWSLSNKNLGCQKWKISTSGNGYSITATHSGKAMDIANGSLRSGTNIWQWHVNGTAAQTWTFEDAGGGYVYIKSGLGTYLDVYNGNTSNGTNIWAYKFNGSNAQKFKLVPLDNGENQTEGHYEYRYGCWVGANGGHSYCNVMAEYYYGGTAHIEYTEWSEARFVNTGTMWTCGCGDRGAHTHEGTGGFIASNTGNHVWYLFSPNGSTKTATGYFWEETRWVS